jgi:hypothetical protein
MAFFPSARASEAGAERRSGGGAGGRGWGRGQWCRRPGPRDDRAAGWGAGGRERGRVTEGCGAERRWRGRGQGRRRPGDGRAAGRRWRSRGQGCWRPDDGRAAGRGRQGRATVVELHLPARQLVDGFRRERRPNLGYGNSDVINRFSYRLPDGVDFLIVNCSTGPILCIGSGMGSGLEAVYKYRYDPAYLAQRCVTRTQRSREQSHWTPLELLPPLRSSSVGCPAAAVVLVTACHRGRRPALHLRRWQAAAQHTVLRPAATGGAARRRPSVAADGGGEDLAARGPVPGHHPARRAGVQVMVGGAARRGQRRPRHPPRRPAPRHHQLPAGHPHRRVVQPAPMVPHRPGTHALLSCTTYLCSHLVPVSPGVKCNVSLC